MLPSTNLYPNSDVVPISVFEHLIYDRTQADIDTVVALKSKVKDGSATADEKSLYLSAISKGAYNYTDVNRINNILTEAKTLLESASFEITYPYPLTNYNENTVLTSTIISQYLANIAVIKNTLSQWITIEMPTQLKTLDEANRVEEILSCVLPIARNVKQCYRHSSEIYCGEQY